MAIILELICVALAALVIGRVTKDPWRSRLVELLKDRPEGASDGDRLLAGKPHDAYLPGYDPNATYPFL